MSTFTKTALYPLQQIQAAQSMATQGLQQSENMQGMINTSTASAKLPSPQQLEAAMLSKDPNQGAKRVHALSADIWNPPYLSKLHPVA